MLGIEWFWLFYIVVPFSHILCILFCLPRIVSKTEHVQLEKNEQFPLFSLRRGAGSDIVRVMAVLYIKEKNSVFSNISTYISGPRLGMQPRQTQRS